MQGINRTLLFIEKNIRFWNAKAVHVQAIFTDVRTTHAWLLLVRQFIYCLFIKFPPLMLSSSLYGDVNPASTCLYIRLNV